MSIADQLSAAQRERVEEILSSLTWEQRLNQVQIVSLFDPDEARAAAASGIGALFWAGSAEATNALQRAAVEESPHGIPLLIGLDVIHGQRTIFPTPLAMGASYDTASARTCAAVSGAEARSGGVTWTFSPMLDVARDPRWGRVAEGFGESPLLTARMGAAMVEGYQHERLDDPGAVVACAKHYVGYGAAEGGRDYNTVDMSEYRLRSVYLPPFEAAVDAGVGTVMASFNTMNGVPVHANRWLLTDLLKGELGFDGAVVGDAFGVVNLIPHGVAEDLADAARQSLAAGLDVEMGGSLWKAGREPAGLLLDTDPELVGRVEDAARRVLSLKMALGLFENPYVDETAEVTAPTTRSLAAAREVASRCPVLLSNDGVLPIAPTTRRILLAGPGATGVDHLGAWVQQFAVPPSRSLADALAEALARSAEAAGEPAPELTVLGDQDPLEVTPEDVDAVAAAAKDAELVLLALTEPSHLTGEASSRAGLHLPGNQAALVHAVVATGTPVAVVMTNGRPLVIGDWWCEPNAVLEAWHLGTTGPEVIADVLTGAINPSGRLPMSFPRTEGQLPAAYDAAEATGRPATRGGSERETVMEAFLAGPQNIDEYFTSKYRDVPGLGPELRVGHGMSYSDLRHSGPALSREEVGLAELAAGQRVEVSVTVTNPSERDAEEPLLLFVHDRVASVAPPARVLVDFARVCVPAGEERAVTLTIDEKSLRLWRPDGGWRVEPGLFDVSLGGSPETTPAVLVVTP